MNDRRSVERANTTSETAHNEHHEHDNDTLDDIRSRVTAPMLHHRTTSTTSPRDPRPLTASPSDTSLAHLMLDNLVVPPPRLRPSRYLPGLPPDFSSDRRGRR